MSFPGEIEDFLLVLQNQYGFLIPMDVTKRCLACAEDITDLEEVYYRLQALVCHDAQQIYAFRSLFGQRFLDLEPNSGNDKQKRKGPGESAMSSVELKRAIQRSQATVHAKKQDMDALEQTISESNQAISSLRDEIKKIGEAVLPEENAYRALRRAASPSPSHPAIQKILEEIEPVLEKIRSDFSRHIDGGIPDMFDIRRAVSSTQHKDELENIISGVLRIAGLSRTEHDAQCFRALMSLATLLKRLQDAAKKTIKAADRKAFDVAEKAAQARNLTVSTMESNLQNLKDSVKRNREVLDSLRRKQEAEAESLEKLLKEKEKRKPASDNSGGKTVELVVKKSSLQHRSIFEGGIHAVQTLDSQKELLSTDLTRMNPQEKEQVLSYIRTNARIFRQTLRRKAATPHHKQVDVKATIRAASKTAGEPIAIRYREPKKSRAHVVILVDISGSCKNASTLALYFAAMMQEAFPGGCTKFVFVDNLCPVDRYFQEATPEEGILRIFQDVPTRGVYSNYGATIHQLRAEYETAFHKDTTLIVLGDARNNRNETSATDFRNLAARCRHVYWLNTEPPALWDTGDSVIRAYREAGADVHHVEMVQDLLSFLEKASLGTMS